MRPCRPTCRSGVEDPVHQALRAAICVPTERYLWVPADMIEFVPALCDTIYGDGRALFGLSTINSRPAFYVIRGDSGWAVSDYPAMSTIDFTDVLDHVLSDLEDQFGRGRLDEEEDDPRLLGQGYNDWPALDDEDGCSWWRMAWPKIPGIETEALRWGDSPHWAIIAILTREVAAEDQLARLADDGGRIIDDPYRHGFWSPR